MRVPASRSEKGLKSASSCWGSKDDALIAEVGGIGALVVGRRKDRKKKKKKKKKKKEEVGERYCHGAPSRRPRAHDVCCHLAEIGGGIPIELIIAAAMSRASRR